MDPHTLRLLDFAAILEELQEYCFSAQGRRLLEAQPIETVPEQVRIRKELATAFRRLLDSGRQLPAGDFPELGQLVARAAKPGALFEPDELGALGRFILSAFRLKRYAASGGQPGLAAIGARIPDLRALAREIFALIDKKGAIRENHVPELKAIRERIRYLQKDAERLAQAYLSNHEYRGFWQSELPGQKNGRLVLPLKSSYRGRIQGIVHDVSATGATLFLEPLDIVEKNNEITEQESRYQREVHRLLRILSSKVTSRAQELPALADAVAELDTLCARARYAILHRCAPAQDLERGLSLLEARHPLLGSQVVPVSLALDAQTRVLVITGPNTGGKTVTLKTAGLLAVMNQFGMEIPAQEGSGLAVFDEILADIGDEQSIEQSLSTFSAHIRNAARIVESSGARSLVLFDELGAGTDPEEGVAIAMALLDHFIARGCLCLATTHHGILKNYGYTRQGVENASVDFDDRTLLPTFRIRMGIPGESHALEIARRNGIPEALIERAEGYLRDERGEIADLVNRLSEKQRELFAAEQVHRNRERELREKTRQTDLLDLRLRQKELELREHGIGELKRFLQDSRREYERIVHRLRQEGEGEARREALDFFHSMEALARNSEEDLARRQEELEKGEEVTLSAGMEVVIRTSGKRGKIVRQGKNNRWVVAMENVRASFTPSQLRAAPRAASGGTDRPEVSEQLLPTAPAYQLDVRGLRLEEALHRLEQQLDRAMVSGLAEFSVVHGLGEGILQRGIHRFLKESQNVKDYYFSTPQEGGFGKTIVKLG
jgi:DNA mismatch repair protein MutS2